MYLACSTTEALLSITLRLLIFYGMSQQPKIGRCKSPYKNIRVGKSLSSLAAIILGHQRVRAIILLRSGIINLVLKVFTFLRLMLSSVEPNQRKVYTSNLSIYFRFPRARMHRYIMQFILHIFEGRGVPVMYWKISKLFIYIAPMSLQKIQNIF